MNSLRVTTVMQASLADLFNNHEQHVPYTQLGTQNKFPACKTPTLRRTRTRSPSQSPPSPSVISSPVANTPADVGDDEHKTGDEDQRTTKAVVDRSTKRNSEDRDPVNSIIQQANPIQHSVPAQEAAPHAPAATSLHSVEGTETEVDNNKSSSQSLRGRMNIYRQSPRMSPGPATIMIGRRTITTAVDSPARKRQRLDHSQERKIASSDPAGSKLLNMVRNLTAPGSQIMIPSVSHAEEEDEELDLSDRADDSSTENLLPYSLEGGISPPTPAEISLDSNDPITREMNNGHQGEQVFLRASNQHEHGNEMGSQTPESGDGGDDEEYVDEQELRAREKRRVEYLIEEAEAHVLTPSAENGARAERLLKGTSQTSIKGRTQLVTADLDTIRQHSRLFKKLTAEFDYIQESQGPAQDAGDLSPEECLTLTISKSDFTRMHIIGQFNRGFIITTRSTPPTNTTMGSEDLFIIDQHASDEKYNFETLQSTTVMRSQPLAFHKPLCLMARDEEIVKDNINNLKANGFTFEIDENAPSGQKCKLLTLPMSENTVFDLHDLEELIHLMSLEGAGGGNEFDKGKGNAKAPVVRPSKVRKMFAMRACRSSVMVGKALTVSQMRKIVRHMAELDKPWNCPHGRPTMRHLCDLKQVSQWKKDFQGVAGCLYRGEKWEEYVLNFREGKDSTIGED